MGPTKLSYTIVHGLSPYFLSELVDNILLSPFFVVCFDEALNKVVQKCQMDIVIRYWDSKSMKVETRYLTSSFLQHATASDLLYHFENALKSFPLDKVIQVSMDGPNVNWSFFRTLNQKIIVDETTPDILDLGSCSLHVLHGAFQNGHKKTVWNINQFLRQIYYYFNDRPARKADFSNNTGENKLPKKFATTRWLENASVAERAIEIHPALKKYFFQLKNTNSSSVATIQKHLTDVMTPSRLHFFKDIASQFEIFLEKFQTPKPLYPLLYASLDEVVRDIMERFVKRDILDGIYGYKYSKIDLKEESNLIPVQKIRIGIGAKNALEKIEGKDKDKLLFYNECRGFLQVTTNKILERSPLKFKFVRSASSLDPKLIATKRNVAVQRFEDAVAELEKKKRIKASFAEKAFKQFKDHVAEVHGKEEVKIKYLNYQTSKDGGLDDFYIDVFKDITKYELQYIMKFVLVLSHGNASVESGFSINKQLLTENQKEQTVVALRRVYDGVLSARGPTKVSITKDLLQSVSHASRMYRDSLEKQKTEREALAKDEEKERMQKKRKANEIKMLLEEKRKMEEESKMIADKLQELQG